MCKEGLISTGLISRSHIGSVNDTSQIRCHSTDRVYIVDISMAKQICLSFCKKCPIRPKHQMWCLERAQCLIFFQPYRISIITVFYYTRHGRDGRGDAELSVASSLLTLTQLYLFSLMFSHVTSDRDRKRGSKRNTFWGRICFLSCLYVTYGARVGN